MRETRGISSFRAWARAGAGTADSRLCAHHNSLLALALNEMGQNAERVGNLTITSEMLASLLNGGTSGPDGGLSAG